MTFAISSICTEAKTADITQHMSPCSVSRADASARVVEHCHAVLNYTPGQFVL